MNQSFEILGVATIVCLFLMFIMGNLACYKRKKKWFFGMCFFSHWFMVGVAISSGLKTGLSLWMIVICAITISAIMAYLCTQFHVVFTKINSFVNS